MRAIAIHESSPSGILTEIELPLPVPSEYEVLVELRATSVHSADMKPGMNVAGIVVDIGRAVKRFKPGDEVFGLKSAVQSSCYAEYILAREDELALKPQGLSFQAAGVLPAAGLAAWQALASARVSSRDRVLVHNGAGGTGSFTVQLAKLRGATVITTISSDAELDVVWGLGADQAMNSGGGEQDFAAILGQSIDVVIDNAGGAILGRSFAVLAPGGRLISTAQPPDPVQPTQLGIHAAYITPTADPFQLSELARLTAGRKLELLIGGSFPFSEEGLHSAHALALSGQAQGVVAITIKE
ncbi:NADP-dependent oxidoreductase [Paenibacillus tritici]|uniref:NADP-dependent oxidoreductase n=1 Tax=Paenibacillus tritici TaxID=1873425 RepID=A0ABX2DWD4_9BACL|nr:NADP-dependent oxidoreductase [Paenibacillus tritici]NQX48303.1 NADP-dependent oxidoreductase [Paenibacillus tritici]